MIPFACSDKYSLAVISRAKVLNKVVHIYIYIFLYLLIVLSFFFFFFY